MYTAVISNFSCDFLYIQIYIFMQKVIYSKSKITKQTDSFIFWKCKSLFINIIKKFDFGGDAWVLIYLYNSLPPERNIFLNQFFYSKFIFNKNINPSSLHTRVVYIFWFISINYQPFIFEYHCFFLILSGTWMYWFYNDVCFVLSKCLFDDTSKSSKNALTFIL